jgi:rod shape-determining protein MreD
MTIDILKRLAWFLVFLFVQVLVLGRIHLFGVATPLLYVYFVLQFPRNHPKWASLLWAFALGLMVDIFFNTPGLAAASLTCVAAVQPYYFNLLLPPDSFEQLKPSFRTLGPVKYIYYSLPLVLLHCLLFFTLEQFSFFNVIHWLLCVVSSTLVTMALILTFETAKK